jgi:hypothetical protein
LVFAGLHAFAVFTPLKTLTISALTPILARSACISSGNPSGIRVVGRCTGMAHKSVVKPSARYVGISWRDRIERIVLISCYLRPLVRWNRVLAATPVPRAEPYR